MFECFKCGNDGHVTRFGCRKCGVAYEGEFETPRLARLATSDQALIETLVLNGGNLSRMSEALQMSYPTLRKRMDALIESLSELRRRDAERVEMILKAVERGEVPPEAAARRIEEMGSET